MAGVFISYSHADQAIAQRVMLALRALGVDVWWDAAMSSVDRLEALKQQADGLVAVVALWTPNSVNSDVVWDEAGFGQKHKRLVGLLHGVDEPPFVFGSIEGISLDGWTGRAPHSGWCRLLETLDAHQAAEGTAAPGALIAAFEADSVDAQARETVFRQAEADPDSARHATMKPAFDDWLRSRGALPDGESATTIAEVEPARPLSLFIPADKLPFAGLEATNRSEVTVPAAPAPALAPAPPGAAAAADTAALDAMTRAVEQALAAAGPDGRPLGRLLRSPLRPPLPASAPPTAAPEAAPVTRPGPADTKPTGPSNLPMLAAAIVIALVIAALTWFVAIRNA